MSNIKIGKLGHQMMAHLKANGSLVDAGGIDIMMKTAEAAMEDSTLGAILTENKISKEKTYLIISSMIEVLMPNPTINVGSPAKPSAMLVPYLLLDKPDRWRMFVQVIKGEEDIDLIIDGCRLQADMIKEIHDSANGEIPFIIGQKGSEKTPAGCASVIALAGILSLTAVTAAYHIIA